MAATKVMTFINCTEDNDDIDYENDEKNSGDNKDDDQMIMTANATT